MTETKDTPAVGASVAELAVVSGALKPDEATSKAWTAKPERFLREPDHLMAGLNG